MISGGVDLFLEMLAAERAAAPNTLAAYEADLTSCAESLAREGQTLQTATTEGLQNWMAALVGSGQARRTVARRLSCIRQFYLFLLREGMRADNPAAHLDSPKPRTPLPRFLSESEVLALLNACTEPAGASLAKKRRGILAKAALELLYASGLRISELLTLPRKAVAGNQRMIMVRGKGGRERLVPLSDSAREAAQALLEVDAHLESPFLFPGRDPAKPMTRQAFDRVLHTVALRAEIDPARLSPTCYAIPSLRICWRMGQICALCRCCWGMQTLPPPRFTRMCRQNALSRLCRRIILWRRILRTPSKKSTLRYVWLHEVTWFYTSLCYRLVHASVPGF